MEGSRPVKGGKLEMDNPVTRISVRNLVEFILQSGDLDNRRGTIDKDAMLKAADCIGSFRNKWAETTEQRLLCG